MNIGASACQCVQRTELGCFPPLIFFYFLRQGVSVTNLRLTPLARLAGQLGSRILYLHPLPLLGGPAPSQKPGLFTFILGIQTQVLTMARWTPYRPSHRPRFYYFIGASPPLSQGQVQAEASCRETSVDLAVSPQPRTQSNQRCRHRTGKEKQTSKSVPSVVCGCT